LQSERERSMQIVQNRRTFLAGLNSRLLDDLKRELQV
jgi:hypothetical protein